MVISWVRRRGSPMLRPILHTVSVARLFSRDPSVAASAASSFESSALPLALRSLMRGQREHRGCESEPREGSRLGDDVVFASGALASPNDPNPPILAGSA